MAIIVRNRTIRPSTRLETSTNYKIDTRAVSRGDILEVNIDHESRPFHKSYKFKGGDLAHKDSISFRVFDFGNLIEIRWSGANPLGTEGTKEYSTHPSRSNALKKKASFPPISNENTRILILGSLPGDKSLELGEYYGHPRNRFWKILSTLTNKEQPVTYAEKKELLLKSGIGVWDVAHKATRNGSMDSAMKDEEPNDLEAFISNHKNLTVIGFNGKKAELLFDKFFTRKSGLKYVSLPSSSPANAGINFEDICAAWKLILV